MLARISSRRNTGFLEGTDPILFNLASQAVLYDWLGDNIHRPLQNLCQSASERINAPEICKTAAPRLLAQLHHHVDVGVLALFAAGRRPEERKARHPGGAKLAFMCSQL